MTQRKSATTKKKAKTAPAKKKATKKAKTASAKTKAKTKKKAKTAPAKTKAKTKKKAKTAPAKKKAKKAPAKKKAKTKKKAKAASAKKKAKKAPAKTKAKTKKAKAAPQTLFRFDEESESRPRYGGERINTWPCWGRAPSRSSAMREPFAPPLETRWTRKLSAAAACSPAVGGDGVLYVADTEGSLQAFDVETGDPRYALRTDPIREASPVWPLVAQGIVPVDRVPVSSTPAVSHNHLLFGDAEGIFYCARRGLGEVLWRKASPLSMASRGAVAYPAPLVFDDHVFAADAEGNVYAAATRNGRPAFRTSVRGRPTAPLALAASRGLLLVACDPLFPNEPRQLLALDAWEGRQAWKLVLPGRTHAVACGRDFALCAGDAGLTAVRLDDGSLAWSLEEPQGTALSLAGWRGFVGTSRGVSCVDLEAGQVAWEQELGPVHGVACAGNVLWCCGSSGLVALAVEDGRVLAKPRLPGLPVGQPVFAAGLLLVATNRRELRALAPRA